LRLQFAPSDALGTIFEFTYQIQRGSDALALRGGRSSPLKNASDHPEFTLKDKAYEAEWSQNYSKSTLTQLVELTVDLRVADTNTVSGDNLVLEIEDQEPKVEAHE